MHHLAETETVTVSKEQLIRLAAGACLKGIYFDGGSEDDDLLAQMGMATCFEVLRELGATTQTELHEFEEAVADEVAKMETS